MRRLTIAVLAAVLALPAFADETQIKLKQAPGVDKVESNCAACHSLDYIQMNSPFMNAATWDAEVTKMIKALGAPINDADAAGSAEKADKSRTPRQKARLSSAAIVRTSDTLRSRFSSSAFRAITDSLIPSSRSAVNSEPDSGPPQCAAALRSAGVRTRRSRFEICRKPFS